MPALLHPVHYGILRDLKKENGAPLDSFADGRRSAVIDMAMAQEPLVDMQGPDVVLTAAGEAALAETCGCARATVTDMPTVRLTTDAGTTVLLHEIERQAIEAALARFGGNNARAKSKAARALGIGRSTLYRKLRTAAWHG